MPYKIPSLIKQVTVIALLLSSMNSFAQKKTFAIVSYTEPRGWTPQQGADYISYSRIDGASWAQIAIYQQRTSEGDIRSDFDKEWKELVESSKTISEPEKTTPQSAEGWTVMSGSGVWQYNGANVASILTVYSNNKVCVSVLCNATAKPYLKEYKKLIGSIDLDDSNLPETSGTGTNAPQPADEPTGSMGIYNTGGFFTGQYLFSVDGTYRFINVLASHYTDSKTLGYEK